MDAVARKVLRSAQQMVPGRFEVRAASKQTHPHAAWADYERARQALEHLGFRFLADVDVVSVSLDPGTSRPTVLRLFVSHDGTAVAGFYRMALRWTLGGIMGRLMGGARGIVDVSTAFGDGTVLETSSAPLVGRWASPPFLLREYQPQMHPAALVARHLQRVAEQVEWNPASRPVRVSTLDEVVAIANVLERRKRAFRESIGWITRDELEKHGAKGPQLDTLHAAVRRIVAEEAAAAAASAPPQAPPAAPSAAEWAAAARSSSAAIQPFADPAPPVGMVEHLATGPWIDTDELPSSASTPALSPSSQAEQHPIDLRDSADVHPAMDTDARTEASADPGIDPERVKAETERALAEAGVSVDPGLPSVDVRRARPLEQVVGRALVMNALINLHFGAPVAVVRPWIEANGVAEHLSPRERALLDSGGGRPAEAEIRGLQRYIEALWVLLWAGGVTDDLAWNRTVPGHMARLVPSLKANEDGSRLSRSMRLRPLRERFGMLDVYYRLDSSGAPAVRRDAVAQRRKALEWLMDTQAEWDEVDLRG